MQAPPSPITDLERLAALRDTDLLDTPTEEAFDQLARVAARVMEAPIALVSLVDEDRQWFKACIGSLPEPWRSQRQTPLSHSFCQCAVASREALVIEDGREHALLRKASHTRAANAATQRYGAGPQIWVRRA